MPDLTLNERAAALMPHEQTGVGFFGVKLDDRAYCYDESFDPENWLDHAAALWRAAPHEVNEAVECSILKKYEADLDIIEATWKLFINPFALTKAVVEKWEEFNASH